MPRSYNNIPGRTLTKDALDTTFGTDLLDPDGFIYPTQSSGSGAWTTATPLETFEVCWFFPASGGKGTVHLWQSLPFAVRVIDARFVHAEAGVTGGTISVVDGGTGAGTTAITDVMLSNGSDKGLVRATSLDDATWELAAGDYLRATTAASGSDATSGYLFVTMARVQ